MLPSIRTSSSIPFSSVNELIELGDFSGAVSALGSEWPGPGIAPHRNEHGDREYASLLMVCGVLTAEFGSRGSRIQEQSKNMLSQSVRLFGDDLDGAQEAQSWLGATYNRCGDYNEALALADTLLQNRDSDLKVTVRSLKTKAIALDGLGHPQAAFDALSEVANVVEGVPPLLRGKFYLQRGKTLRTLGRLDDALEDYDLATECFYSTKALRYEAAVSNNIAGVYLDRDDFARAHVLTEKAVRLFKNIRDENYEGKAWDQIAQIYRKEGKYHSAERASERAINLLERGDHLHFLAEALTTYGTILVEKGMSAILPLQRAAEIYAQQNNTTNLETVNSLMWDAVVKVKKLAKETSAAMHQAVRPVEKQIIQQALEKHYGHVSPAAKELGMTHRGLTENIKRHFPELAEKCGPVTHRKKSLFKT